MFRPLKKFRASSHDSSSICIDSATCRHWSRGSTFFPRPFITSNSLWYRECHRNGTFTGSLPSLLLRHSRMACPHFLSYVVWHCGIHGEDEILCFLVAVDELLLELRQKDLLLPLVQRLPALRAAPRQAPCLDGWPGTAFWQEGMSGFLEFRGPHGAYYTASCRLRRSGVPRTPTPACRP